MEYPERGFNRRRITEEGEQIGFVGPFANEAEPSFTGRALVRVPMNLLKFMVLLGPWLISDIFPRNGREAR